MSASAYRPDIDGLRTIAVLSVVVFHAFPNSLSGGFVGVDIFFVISGFLITGLLIDDEQHQRYSIGNFYSRRVRRIFPALLTVMVVSLCLGWVVLTADEYEQLGKHIAGGAAFLANFIFNREAGYFDNAADTKPMLHLWSLGVEEQFYLVWPLMVPFILRRSSSARWILLAVLFVLSMVYSEWALNLKPTLAFYSPVSRFWELLAGAGLALALRTRQTQGINSPGTNWIQALQGNSALTASMSIAGLICMLIAIASYTEQTRFPGLSAVLPVLGTVLVIAAGGSSPVNRLILANRPMVWMGLISYPVYLWHWPLLSFARILESQTPAPGLRALLLLATVGLAWLTWQLIEQPVRRSKSRAVIPILAVLMVLVFAGALYVKKKDGLGHRHYGLLNADPATLDLGKRAVRFEAQCGLSEADKAAYQYCIQAPGGPPNLALFGDSKGEALFYGLLHQATEGQRWMLIGSVAAPPVGSAGEAVAAQKSIRARDLLIQTPSVRTIVLAVALRGIFSLDSDTGYPLNPSELEQRLAEYSDLIARFQAAGKQVVFFMDNPTFPDPKSCISGGMTRNEVLNTVLRRAENPRCKTTVQDYQAGIDTYTRFVAALKTKFPDLVVVDPLPQLCSAETGVCSVSEQGQFLYSYGDHLSLVASKRIAKAYFSAF